MAGESRIDIIIAARDQAKGVIQGVNQELGTLNQSAGSAASGISGLGLAFGAVAAIQLGRQVFEMAELGAQAERTQTAFTRLTLATGQSGAKIVEALRNASRGTISDTNLMLDASRAMASGVAKNADDLTKLLDVARARGALFGRSTQDAFDDIVTGIQRMSPLILDNLGIVTGGQKTFDDYAASIGKSASQLSDAEKKQALFNKVINDSRGLLQAQGDAAIDGAGKFERLFASWQNFQTSFGKNKTVEFSVGVSADILQAFADKGPIKATTDAWKELFDLLINGKSTTDEVANSTSNLAAILPGYGASASDAAGATNQFDAELAKLAPDLQYLGDLALTTGDKIDVLRSKLAAVRATNADINAAQSSAASAIINAAKSALPILGKDETLRMAQQQLATLEGQTNALKQQGKAGADLQLTYADLENQLKAPFENVVEQQRQAESASKRWASTVQNDLVKAYNDLQGKVKSVLGGAFNVDVGVDPDKILGRSDAINEPARRLADVAVNGFKSPWLEYFRTDFPQLFQEFFAGAAGDEGVKKNAAQLLKNFEDGLAPELIDKEKAKERVRRMILGEQATDELVKEITDELNAEFGRTAPADLGSLVQQAVGGGTQGKAAGISTEAAGKAFNDAAVNAVSQTGNKVISTVDEQLRADANLAKLGQAGNIGGTKYGAEFLSGAINNIAQPFLDYVTKIVTGNVIANINTQNQLKGVNP